MRPRTTNLWRNHFLSFLGPCRVENSSPQKASPPRWKNESHHLTFHIPPHLQGHLIGECGQNIQRLRQTTGASIRTDSEVPGRLFLRGQINSVRRAQQDILQKLFGISDGTYGIVLHMEDESSTLEFVEVENSQGHLDKVFPKELCFADGIYALRFIVKGQDHTPLKPDLLRSLSTLNLRHPAGRSSLSKPLVERLKSTNPDQAAFLWSDIIKLLATDYDCAQARFERKAHTRHVDNLDAINLDTSMFALSKTLLFKVRPSLIGKRLSYKEFKVEVDNGNVQPMEGVYSPANTISAVVDAYIGRRHIEQESFYKTAVQGWYRGDKEIWSKWVHQVLLPYESDNSMTFMSSSFRYPPIIPKRRCFIVSPSFALGQSAQLVLQFSPPNSLSNTPSDKYLLDRCLSDFYGWLWRQGPPSSFNAERRWIPVISPKAWNQATNAENDVTFRPEFWDNIAREVAACMPFTVRRVDTYKPTRGIAVKREYDGGNELVKFGKYARNKDDLIKAIELKGNLKDMGEEVTWFINGVMRCFGPSSRR